MKKQQKKLMYGALALVVLAAVLVFSLNSNGSLFKGQLGSRVSSIQQSSGNDCLALNKAYFEKGASDQVLEVYTRKCGEPGASTVVIPQKMTKMSFELTLANSQMKSIRLMKNGKIVPVGMKPGMVTSNPQNIIANDQQSYTVSFDFSSQTKFATSDRYTLVGDFVDNYNAPILNTNYSQYLKSSLATVVNISDAGTMEMMYVDSL